jgi:hypothetical protein
MTGKTTGNLPGTVIPLMQPTFQSTLQPSLQQTMQPIVQPPLQPTLQQRLVSFLEHDLSIPTSAIDIGLRQHEQSAPLPDNLLPMVLWQYGLITIEQLDQVFDWMEKA